MGRKPLEIGALDDFAPRKSEPATRPKTQKAAAPEPAAPAQDAWQRREASPESQFTIRARIDTIERFKRMCRPAAGGRFTYGEMLERLMDRAEDE